MTIEDLIDHALTGLAAAYYENINYEPKYAKLFCKVYLEGVDMTDLSKHTADFDELKEIK